MPTWEDRRHHGLDRVNFLWNGPLLEVVVVLWNREWRWSQAVHWLRLARRQLIRSWWECRGEFHTLAHWNLWCPLDDPELGELERRILALGKEVEFAVAVSAPAASTQLQKQWISPAADPQPLPPQQSGTQLPVQTFCNTVPFGLFRCLGEVALAASSCSRCARCLRELQFGVRLLRMKAAAGF